MAKEKKQPSFNDFIADDNFVSNEEETEEVEQPDPNKDDELEVKTPVKEKKVVKKQPKSKTEFSTAGEDNDNQSDDENLEVEAKKPAAKKAPVKVVPIVEEELEEVEEETGNPLKFFEEVEKITGSTIEVDYGDTDPLTPQGIALREKAVKEQALDSFLEEIEEKFPAAFRALQHAYNGGDISELFTATTGRDYSKIQLTEGDDALAKQILTEFYKASGIKNEAKIAKLIENDEDSEGGVFKEAQSALAELQERQNVKTNEVVEIQKQKAAEQKKRDQILVTAVDEVLESKKLGSFRITDRMDASEFKKFVLSSLRRNENGYEIATQINPAELEKQLQYAYFQFKKGDLGKIIQQKAATENAEKLRLKLQTEQSKGKRSTEQGDKTGASMQDYYVS